MGGETKEDKRGPVQPETTPSAESRTAGHPNDVSALPDVLLSAAEATIRSGDRHVTREDFFTFVRKLAEKLPPGVPSSAREGVPPDPDRGTAKLLVDLARSLSCGGNNAGANYLAVLMVNLSKTAEKNLVEQVILAAKIAIAEDKEIDASTTPLDQKIGSWRPSSRLETLLLDLFAEYSPGWEAGLRRLYLTGMSSYINGKVAGRLASWKCDNDGRLQVAFEALLEPLDMPKERKQALLRYAKLAVLALIAGTTGSARASAGQYPATRAWQFAARGIGMKIAVGVGAAVALVAAVRSCGDAGSPDKPFPQPENSPPIGANPPPPTILPFQYSEALGADKARDGLALYYERDRLLAAGDQAFDAERFSEALRYYSRAAAIVMKADDLDGHEKEFEGRLISAILCRFLSRNSNCFSPYELRGREVITGQDQYVEKRTILARLGESVVTGNPDGCAQLKRECEALPSRKWSASSHAAPPWRPFYLSSAVTYCNDAETVISCLGAEVARFESPERDYMWVSWGDIADGQIVRLAFEHASRTDRGRALLAEICRLQPPSAELMDKPVGRDDVLNSIAGATRTREYACRLVSR